MLPFALLGVFLVDSHYFAVTETIEMAKQIPQLWKNMVYYLAFTILLEFVLRILGFISKPFLPEKGLKDWKKEQGG